MIVFFKILSNSLFILSFKAICFQLLTGTQNRDYTKFQYNRHLCYFSVQDNFICARNYWDQRRVFRRNRSTADRSAFDISLRETGNRMWQLVRFVELTRGYDAIRREVLYEVSYNILFEFFYLPTNRQVHKNAFIRNLR
jgi:hypothetical protein